MITILDTATDWNTYILNIDSDRGPLTVKWQDTNTLALYVNLQTAVFQQPKNNLQTFYEYFPKVYQFYWDVRHGQGIFDLPNNAKILDISCGCAVVDLLLAQYIPNSEFYLLDIDHFNFNAESYENYSNEYQVYHSWDPIRDAIQTTGLNPERFNFIGPTDSWPEQLDAITAYFGYCWHFPKNTYWDRVIHSLKKGGKLVLDIRHLNDNTIEEISDAMKSKPSVTYFDKSLRERAAAPPYNIKVKKIHSHLVPGVDRFTDTSGLDGGRYCWTRC